MGFAKGFYWGAASAAYQIEGAPLADGKGISVWDAFCERNGTTFEGQSGTTACDFYHKYAEDISLFKQIGLTSYRLSISWPRVIPEGTGTVNSKGLDFYDRVIDELLRNGIEPFVTLFHWDYPYALLQKGGWLNPDSSDWFAAYAEAVVRRLGDRVKYFMTFNEQAAFINVGHKLGLHAPGLKYDRKELHTVVRNVLLSHGKASGTIRSEGRDDRQVGFAPTGLFTIPYSTSPEDIEAARGKMFDLDRDDFYINSWWYDPVFFGTLGENGEGLSLETTLGLSAEEIGIIHDPPDFIGTNVYFGGYYRSGAAGRPESVPYPEGMPRSALYWQMTPEVLYWAPKFLYERYGKPILISENGMSSTDWVHLDGRVHDEARIDFLRRYLIELRRAADEGVPILGYQHWSATDNFEWAEGFKERFGLIHVDYATQVRTIKESGHYYSKIIASNGQSL
jgi:beta-glucosidase